MTRLERLIALQKDLAALSAEESALNKELCEDLQRKKPQGARRSISRLDVTRGLVVAERVELGRGCGTFWIEPLRWSLAEGFELLGDSGSVSAGNAPVLSGKDCP